MYVICTIKQYLAVTMSHGAGRVRAAKFAVVQSRRRLLVESGFCLLSQLRHYAQEALTLRKYT